MSAYRVAVADRARTDLAALLTTRFAHRTSSHAKIEFLLHLDSLMEQLSRWPEASRTSQQFPPVRECIVDRHTIMYYWLADEVVEILSIQDARQLQQSPFESENE